MINKYGSRKVFRVGKTLKPYIMKKGILILLGMFMMVSTAEAKNGKKLTNRVGFNYTYNNSVNFIERGIEFYIFTNGDFDFNTRRNNTYFDYNGRRVRNNGVRIDRDFRGRIRRVGNVFINYDLRGNVTRIGNIFIDYRRGKLSRVGDLRVRYDRWGYPVFYGNVRDFYYNNGIRFDINFGDVFDYNDAYFFRRDFRRNYSQIREDNNFYYYKAKPNAKIGKRSKILKRRKPASKRFNKGKTVKRKADYSYRKSDNNRNKIKKPVNKRNSKRELNRRKN